MNKVDKEFLNRAAYYSASMVLFSKDVVLEMIEYCRKENIKILGLDPFYIWNIVYTDKIVVGVQPNYAYDIDTQYSDNVYDCCISEINSINDNRFYFELWIDDNIRLEHDESLAPSYFRRISNIGWIPDCNIISTPESFTEDFHNPPPTQYAYVNIYTGENFSHKTSKSQK